MFVGTVVPPTEPIVHVSGALVAAGAAVGVARHPSIEVSTEETYVVPAAGLVPPVPLVPLSLLPGAVPAKRYSSECNDCSYTRNICHNVMGNICPNSLD